MENILNIILERDKTKFVLGIMKDGKERTKQELLALDCLAESIRISIGTFDLLLNGNNEEKETFIRNNQNDTSRSLQTSN